MITYKLNKAALNGNVYPVQVNINTVDMEKLKREIAQSLGPSGAATLEEVIRLIGLHLSEGDTVTLDGLGTFSLRLGITKNGLTEYEDVRSQDIVVKGIRFMASKQLKQKAQRQQIHLLKGEKQMRLVTLDQRFSLLLKYLRSESMRTSQPIEQQYITTKTYRLITGCTDYKARTELEELAVQGKLIKQSIGRTAVYQLVAEE